MSRFERWSRIKRGLNDASQDAPETSLAAFDAPPTTADTSLDETDQVFDEAIADSTTEPVSELTDERDELDVQLPDPSSLDPSGDFKAYLTPGVSPELKRRALRHMFTASQYNVRDGLDDYDQDFTQIRDLSREVASTLRRWVNEVAEDTESVDDGDTQSLATQASGESHDNPTSDSAQVATNQQNQGVSEKIASEGQDTPMQSETSVDDPLRPTDGTV